MSQQTHQPLRSNPVSQPAPEAFLELALRCGAEAAEVFQSESLARPVTFEANRLRQLETSQADGLALRLWRNGRPGLAVAYGAVEPQALVDRALALSDLNEPEALELVAGATRREPDLGKAVPVEQLVQWGKEAIAQVRDKYSDVLCSAGFDCEVETTRLINSKGLDCRSDDTTLSGYLEVEWVRGDDFLNIGDGVVDRQTLNPKDLTAPVLQRLAWAQENAEITTGRLPVILTAKAADLLWMTVQSALSGKQVFEGSSPWMEMRGKAIANPMLTLKQDPNLGPFSCLFDDEGTETQARNYIESGVLQGFYADRTVGRSLGMESTGNGFRSSLGSYPTPGLFNLIVVSGKQDLEAMIASLDEGLILDQILGGGAGISGDFSINVDLGYQVSKGQIVGRVKDTMVSGNVYQALKQLVTIGSDGAWSGSCWTPSVLVEGFSVTGRSV
jgi:PmbA protein